MTLLTSCMSTRNQFGGMMKERAPNGVGVEVGVHRGDFSEVLLRDWTEGTLWLIDPWDVPPGYEEQAKTLWGDAPTREHDLAETRIRMKEFPGRHRIFRGSSPGAASEFVCESVDFVYLDGDHERPGIDKDLEAWWPKLKAGGVLAGHDFVMPGEPDGLWARHIQPAVMEFASEEKRDVHMILEEEAGLPWSWYVLK